MPNEEMNLPSTMSRSRIGAVLSKIIVPDWRSSASKRMASMMPAIMVAAEES